jgi:phosphoribosylformylglycinamidine (FGAM) synthase-like amidotransferase family enzyme
VKIGVVTFPGSLDDRDAQRAVRYAGAEAVPLWHADPDLHGVDAVVLPGGFSYGDYLRCGAIARFAKVMETIARLEGEGRVAFRYLEVNPNGSLNDIAGIANERGNVVGLMPHPEHATEEGFGPDTDAAMRNGTDGLVFFTSAIGVLAL